MLSAEDESLTETDSEARIRKEFCEDVVEDLIEGVVETRAGESGRGGRGGTCVGRGG